jgi:hypothetical protein
MVLCIWWALLQQYEAGFASRAILVEHGASHIHGFRERVDGDHGLYDDSVFIYDCCWKSK